MIVEWLDKVPWDHPGIVGPVAAALTAGVFKLMERKKPSTQTVNVVLPEKDVGQELSKALDPLSAGIAALSDQLAATQLAPKQKVPDSGSADPLKLHAVEFFNAGVDAYNKGEIGQALGHWLDALKLDPDNERVHNNIGAALEEKGELHAAIEHLSAALRIAPNSAIVHYNIGNTLAAKGELDAAIKHWSTALRIKPAYASPHYNLGVALNDKGEIDAAIEHWDAALRIEPDHAEAHNNLGAALIAKGELDVALEHFNAALRIDPDEAAVHFNRGCVLAQKNDAAPALAALANAIELDPCYRDNAKTDADYDPIRDAPAFRKLIDAE